MESMAASAPPSWCTSVSQATGSSTQSQNLMKIALAVAKRLLEQSGCRPSELSLQLFWVRRSSCRNYQPCACDDPIQRCPSAHLRPVQCPQSPWGTALCLPRHLPPWQHRPCHPLDFSSPNPLESLPWISLSHHGYLHLHFREALTSRVLPTTHASSLGVQKLRCFSSLTFFNSMV